jgi:5-methylthioadenosine/S-adenosylhomocysteine deaminase
MDLAFSEFMYPVSTAITPDQVRVGVQLGAAEAARSGVTAVLDNHFAPTDLETTLAVADSIAEVGIRGAVARGILGEPTEMASKHILAEELFRFSNEEELEITAAAIDERFPGSRVAGAPRCDLPRPGTPTAVGRPSQRPWGLVAHPLLAGGD